MKGILHLTLYRKWFDKIASGEKTEAYRKASAYWFARLANKKFSEVHFTNGYGNQRPFMRVEWKRTDLVDTTFIIKLGKILEKRGYIIEK